jgi:nitric oxide reductase large subunit
MDYRIAAFRLRSLALYGLAAGLVNGALLGLPLAYGVMEVTRVLRPGDGTDAALAVYAAIVVFATVGGAVGATLCGLLYNRLTGESGGVRLSVVDAEG